jgi:MFS family permease
MSLIDRVGGRAAFSVLALLTYQGFALALNGVAAPWIMRSFALDQSGIARLFAVTSVSALGAFLLARIADRQGRRTVLIACATATPLCALGAALSSSITLFAIFDTILLSAAGATVASSVVWISEAAGGRDRPTGQGFGGLALVLGSGPAVVAMPWLARTEVSWRGLFLMAASGAFVVPVIARWLPETGPWLRAASRQANRRPLPAFDPLSRRRIRPIVITTFLSTIATGTVDSWRYFHMVAVTGLAPATASALLIACGLVGTAGFAIGAAWTDRLGRVPSVARFVVLMAIAIAASFWGPPRGSRYPALWLAAGFGAVSLFGNALGVAANTVVTELFPTPLRGSVMGSLYLVGAIGRVVAQTLVAGLSGPMGGVSTIVGALGLIGIAVAVIFATTVPETRGLPLPVDVDASLNPAIPPLT